MRTDSQAAEESEELVIEQANEEDVDLLMAIHEDVARWLWDRGIHQWQPGAFPRTVMEQWAARGEAYIARRRGQPVGMVALTETDEYMWPGASPDALYLHGLRVQRAFGGQGIGRALLLWAEAEARARGKRFLRLDVMADNPVIRAYYESAGFERRGDTTDKPWPGSLYEKRIAASSEGRAMHDGDDARTVETHAGRYRIVRAGRADADTVIDMLDEAAAWLTERGIDQWTPGNFDRAALNEEIEYAEFYLVLPGGETDTSRAAATFSLQWRDPDVWGMVPEDACYLHNFAVRRAFAGQELGLRILDWAAERAAASGKTYLRLDCVAWNEPLNDYYRRAGFTYRGQVGHYRPASLYERPAGAQ
jgi:ribosomal protein S18 acetylase RimI-like enzyme